MLLFFYLHIQEISKWTRTSIFYMNVFTCSYYVNYLSMSLAFICTFYTTQSWNVSSLEFPGEEFSENVLWRTFILALGKIKAPDLLQDLRYMEYNLLILKDRTEIWNAKPEEILICHQEKQTGTHQAFWRADSRSATE